MKKETPEQSSIFELDIKILLDILEKNVLINSNSDLKNSNDNINNEENRLHVQIGIAFKELKQALLDNKTNFEDECKTIIQNYSFNNKKINGIDKDDFFNIFQKYKIDVEEKVKQSIFEFFKVENSEIESSQNDISLVDYDKILSFIKK